MSVTPILIWLAAIGAGPELNLNNPPALTNPNVFGQTLLSAALQPVETPANKAASEDQRLPTFRAQSGDNEPRDCDPPEFELASPCPRGIHRDLIYELLDTFNPFSKSTVRVLPGYYDPYGWQGSFGTNGYQPWRLGWSLYHDVAILPFSTVTGGTTGEMKMVEWNSNTRLSELIAPGVLFNGTGYFNAHYWDGPGGIALPGQVDQVSLDMELGFFNDGPWSAQVAFHPQIVDGYDSPLNHYAINIDGRAIVSYLASPNWTFVGGFAVWDRVDLLVIPHVGAVWTPDTRWELRLLYPRTRISYYLGQRGKSDFWLYGVAEYTAEAWQADIGDPVTTYDRIQLTDDRISLGLRWDSGRHSVFIEGGYVFNRQAKFAGPTPNFDLNNVGMVRAGVRF
jgi:hypothetical protein